MSNMAIFYQFEDSLLLVDLIIHDFAPVQSQEGDGFGD